MTPTNSPFNKDTCVSTSSNCVVWEGPDLECISLCKGDTVSEAVYKMAHTFCEFKDEFDFTDIDLKCIFEACEACPEPEKSLRNILVLLIDKVCDLQEQIDEFDPSTDSVEVLLEVNLKCLAITDGSGNVLNDDTNSEIVQAIIDQVCETVDDVEVLENEVEDHETRITTLENEPDATIPDVGIACIFAGVKPIDEAFELLGIDYCDFKDNIGSSSDISAGIAQQCALPALVGNPDFIVSPVNLAESFSNLWLAYCNVLTRLTLIEETCCAPSCDSIKIGFSTTFNADDTVTLEFNAGTGTTIPAGWTDCGTVLTITDTNGNSATVMLTLVNNYTSPDIDLTGFSTGSLLTFTLDVKMCNDSITCQKCVTKTVTYSNTDCCSITNTGEDDITVIYTTETTILT